MKSNCIFSEIFFPIKKFFWWVGDLKAKNLNGLFCIFLEMGEKGRDWCRLRLKNIFVQSSLPFLCKIIS